MLYLMGYDNFFFFNNKENYNLFFVFFVYVYVCVCGGYVKSVK